MEEFGDSLTSPNELNVSFGFQCNASESLSLKEDCMFELSSDTRIQESTIRMRSSSFSCLCGAALSANFTLANTKICNGLFSEEILPNLDSPKSFRRLSSSPSLSRLDLLPSSHNSISTMGVSSTDSDIVESSKSLWKPMSAPTRMESSSFLNVQDLQMAGGAAGEDRVQAVCSEADGWLFCGVYDGFNGRDAADFLAVTLYENIVFYVHLLKSQMKQQALSCVPNHKSIAQGTVRSQLSLDLSIGTEDELIDTLSSSDSFRRGVLDCLSRSLAQAENDFMNMVELEMEERPDLVSVGSCVLTALLHGSDLYVLCLGDSRAVLATWNEHDNDLLQAVQLTETHTVDDETEYKRILADHPDDPSPVVRGKLKGKLKLTRAVGVGYLKKSKFNDALMGILRVQNLCSLPYVTTEPFTLSHRVSENDLFVILGSDGLFDFFCNDEVVKLVYKFIQENPFGDPAKYLVEQLVCRAAENAGFSIEELMSIPPGRRRKYHDDVTVIVIILGNKQRTSKASSSL